LKLQFHRKREKNIKLIEPISVTHDLIVISKKGKL